MHWTLSCWRFLAGRGTASPVPVCGQTEALGSLGMKVGSKRKSLRNHAELSPRGGAELFQHPSLGLCPKLSSFKLQLHPLCLVQGTQRDIGDLNSQSALINSFF